LSIIVAALGVVDVGVNGAATDDISGVKIKKKKLSDNLLIFFMKKYLICFKKECCPRYVEALKKQNGKTTAKPAK